MGRPGKLAEEHRRALVRLIGLSGIDRFYLVGGTAIAYHLGHRISEDLHLFSIRGRVDLDALRTQVETAIPGARFRGSSDVILKIEVEGIPVDFVAHPYPPANPPIAGPEGVNLATLPDLGAMKFAAICRRGIRRDFWDLHEIVVSGGVALDEVRTTYQTMFGASQDNLYHVLRSLTWFADAEAVPEMPRGLTDVQWEEIKRFFLRETPRLLDTFRKSTFEQ